MEQGHGTNYAASWYLVRGDAKLEKNGNVATTSSVYDLKGLGGTTGPLRMRTAEGSKIPTSNIPLMGCGAPGDTKDAVLSATIPGQNVYEGDRLAESFNDGPAMWDDGGVDIDLMPRVNPAPRLLHRRLRRGRPPHPGQRSSSWRTGWFRRCRRDLVVAGHPRLGSAPRLRPVIVL